MSFGAGVRPQEKRLSVPGLESTQVSCEQQPVPTGAPIHPVLNCRGALVVCFRSVAHMWTDDIRFAPKKPWKDLIPLQIPRKNGFLSCQSSAQ